MNPDEKVRNSIMKRQDTDEASNNSIDIANPRHIENLLRLRETAVEALATPSNRSPFATDVLRTIVRRLDVLFPNAQGETN